MPTSLSKKPWRKLSLSSMPMPRLLRREQNTCPPCYSSSMSGTGLYQLGHLSETRSFRESLLEVDSDKNLVKSVISTTGVVGDFILHDRPAGKASGRTRVFESSQLEVIEPNQVPVIVQAQEPTPSAIQGTPSTWDVHGTAQDAQSGIGPCLYNLRPIPCPAGTPKPEGWRPWIL